MMRAARLQLTLALVGLVLVATGGAQTPSGATGDRRPEQAATQAAKTDQAVTIVGCLEQRSSAQASGETQTTRNADEFFVRTPAIAVPVGTTLSVGRAPSGTPATPGGTTTSAGTPTETVLYRITGLSRDHLRPHIGHRVELQGQLSGNLGNASGSETTSTTRETTGVSQTKDRPKVAGVLDATAIKMVSASCS